MDTSDPRPTDNDRPPLPVSILLGAGAAALIIGAFLPWVKATIPFLGSISVSGMDGAIDGRVLGAADGWLFIALGVAVGALALRANQGRPALRSAMALGVLAAILVAVEWATIERRIAELGEYRALASTGFGIYLLALGAAIVLGTSVVAWSRAIPEASPTPIPKARRAPRPPRDRRLVILVGALLAAAIAIFGLTVVVDRRGTDGVDDRRGTEAGSCAELSDPVGRVICRQDEAARSLRLDDLLPILCPNGVDEVSAPDPISLSLGASMGVPPWASQIECGTTYIWSFTKEADARRAATSGQWLAQSLGGCGYLVVAGSTLIEDDRMSAKLARVARAADTSARSVC